MCKKVVVFDLDDTLYKEIDFLKSGYRKVAELVEKWNHIDANEVYDHMLSWYFSGENTFACLNDKYKIDIPLEYYLNVYRYHKPAILLSAETKAVLHFLHDSGCILGIISDGREITQKLKVDALGLMEWISVDNILINENQEHFKPSHWSFDRMMLRCYGQCPNSELSFYYIGDNPEKDFLAPNQLGWITICLLDDGRNIHRQTFSSNGLYLPNLCIRNMKELLGIVNTQQ